MAKVRRHSCCTDLSASRSLCLVCPLHLFHLLRFFCPRVGATQREEVQARQRSSREIHRGKPLLVSDYARTKPEVSTLNTARTVCLEDLFQLSLVITTSHAFLVTIPKRTAVYQEGNQLDLAPAHAPYYPLMMFIEKGRARF